MGRVRSFDALREVADGVAADGSIRARFRAQAIDLARAEGLARARFVHRVVPLEAPAAATLRLGGECFEAPRLLPESGTLTALACGAATLGVGIGERVSSLFSERRMSLALALDALGNAMLIEASRRLQDAVLAAVNRAGLTMAGELRPGDPGLALAAQPAVLRLAGAEALGLAVTASLALNPAKSTTVVYGVGRDLPAVVWSRCDDCRSRPKCRMRRVGAVSVPA
jgi:hypothetical protein